MKINAINSSMFSVNKTHYSKNNVYFTKPLNADYVTFSAKPKTQKIDVDVETAKTVAKALSTSTSGYRAEYGTEKFNKKIVEAITVGVADYAINAAKILNQKPVVMVGGDTRQATKEMIPVICDVLSKKGIEVIKADKPTPTPVFAQAAQDKNLPVSILMTASHNPWADGGYNLVTNEGAIAPPAVTEQVAKYIVAAAEKGDFEVKSKKDKGKILKEDLYVQYAKDLDKLKQININWGGIKKANIQIYYDGLKGTGSNVFPRLMKEHGIKIEEINSGKKKGPNPTAANLVELSEKVRADKSPLVVGLANDGDADRFGVIDEKGNFLTPNDVILLTAYHLSKNKGINGAIVRSQATTGSLDVFAANKDIKVLQTPVGFKYIAEDILKERANAKDILVAGEESGGLTVTEHIPEKDGILAITLMLDLVASEKKPLSEILKDVKSNMPVQINNIASDKTYKPGEKDKVMAKVDEFYKSTTFSPMNGQHFSENFIIDAEKTLENEEIMKTYKKGGDGYKFYMMDGSSVLIRKSGTEDKIKEYIEVISDKALPQHQVIERVNELKTAADELIKPLS